MKPQTAAGRSMLDDWHLRRTHPPTAARQESYRQFIVAIEAEARAAALDEAIAAVKEAAEPVTHGSPRKIALNIADLLAVLEALRGKRPR